MKKKAEIVMTVRVRADINVPDSWDGRPETWEEHWASEFIDQASTTIRQMEGVTWRRFTEWASAPAPADTSETNILIKSCCISVGKLVQMWNHYWRVRSEDSMSAETVKRATPFSLERAQGATYLEMPRITGSSGTIRRMFAQAYEVQDVSEIAFESVVSRLEGMHEDGLFETRDIDHYSIVNADTGEITSALDDDNTF